MCPSQHPSTLIRGSVSTVSWRPHTLINISSMVYKNNLSKRNRLVHQYILKYFFICILKWNFCMCFCKQVKYTYFSYSSFLRVRFVRVFECLLKNVKETYQFQSSYFVCTIYKKWYRIDLNGKPCCWRPIFILGRFAILAIKEVFLEFNFFID